MSELDSHIDERVAKTEVATAANTEAIKALTGDVRSLAATVEAQGRQTNAQIQNLVAAVTAAGGPRKTEWGLLMQLCMFVIAVGALAFVPLNKDTSLLREDYARLAVQMARHSELDMHPVGKVRIDAVEKMLTSELIDLDKKLQTEYNLIAAKLSSETAALDLRLKDVKDNGSTVTRERLAVIESKLKDLRKEL